MDLWIVRDLALSLWIVLRWRCGCAQSCSREWLCAVAHMVHMGLWSASEASVYGAPLGRLSYGRSGSVRELAAQGCSWHAWRRVAGSCVNMGCEFTA